MHPDTKIIEFIALRSQNWSLNRIAKEINVSLRTLVEWNSDFSQTLKVLRAVKTDELHQTLAEERQNDIQTLSTRQEAIDKELARRRLGDVPTDKLIRLAILTREELVQSRLDAKQLVGSHQYIPDTTSPAVCIDHIQTPASSASSRKEPMPEDQSDRSTSDESLIAQKQCNNSAEIVQK